MVLHAKTVRYAHSDGHTDVCYGSDNNYLITCGSDGNVRVWNGSDDYDPTADSVAEMALAVACNKDQFFVATDSNYVQAFTFPDRKRGKIMFRFSAPVTQICVSSSAKYMAAGSCDMEVQILNIETNKITILTGHTAPILGVSLDPLDEYIVSSSCDGSVKIWEISTGSLVKTFHNIIPIKNDFFKAICLGRTAWKSISGTLLAIPKDLKVFIYKRGTWEFSCELQSYNIENPLSVAMFSPCGNYVAGGSSGGEIVIWEIKHKSEVCNFKDPKKIGICGMAWHADGSEIAYSDRLGRLSVLTGINEEITRHMAPKWDVDAEETKNDSEDYFENEIDVNELFNSDDDDDDDDVNEHCISIEKIKASYKNESEDDKSLGSPASPKADENARELATPITKQQPPFQPSSTPCHFEPRCLCFNGIGIVRYYDSDRTIDVQFHDTTFHHALFLRSFGVCTMATLSTNVLCLAVSSIEDSPSKLSCVPLSPWAGSKEWTVHMPEKEDILAVAAGGSWVAIATNANQMRIFTHAGTQKHIVSLPGTVVSMAGHEQKILVVCHLGISVLGNQSQSFIIYQISNLCVRVVTPFQPLPLFPKSVLKWIGFSDEGTPSNFDSEGILRFLSHDSLHWEVACDTRIQKKSPSDHYFVVGLSERYQNIRCVLCRNSFYPLVINTPTVLEIPLKLPFCSPDSEKSIQEDAFWRLLFSMHSLQKVSLENSDVQNDVARFEQTLKQTALKLFAEACRNSEDLRALDIATLMSSHPLEMAIKYSSKVGKMYLAEKLNNIVPVDWKNQYSEGINCTVNITETENFGSSDVSVYSSQDLLQDSPVAVEKENTPSVAKESSKSPEIPKSRSINPFKKAEISKNERPKGLKFFDLLATKESPKPNNPDKPPKLKLSGASNTKSSEINNKKPTFVEWFSLKKAPLSEEYPNMSSSELTKLGVKIYKEEMNRENEEKVVESRKRSLEAGDDSESKWRKVLNENHKVTSTNQKKKMYPLLINAFKKL